ncbi:uncharacterized protein VNE69_10157 [Vairimorpha necatrix]|uniref:Uncharacterized protein n=1 Tax=Vairimorpha necatrix TaxID=6039 RepID=A0AAX4JFP8_9MICR
MDSEYQNIISSKQIDKFIITNKYEPEIISPFINYLLSNNYSYWDYKSLLNVIIDIKDFSELPNIFHSLVSSDYDLLDLIDTISKMSVNIIQKFRGAPILVETLFILVDISNILYDKEWYYETCVILNIVSLFITNCYVNNKNLNTQYYKVISKIFLRSDNYYSALNALEEFTDDNKVFRKDILIELLKYKNEKNKYSQYLLKKDLKDFQNDHQVDLSPPWDFYIKNIGQKIKFCRENIKFISFLSRHNIEFSREGDDVILGHYKYQSVDSRVCDIIEKYKKKEEKVKIFKEVTVQKEVKEIKKKKEVSFPDNFTLKKAKFNIYCDILRNKYKKRDIMYNTRNEMMKRQVESYNNIIREKMEFLKDEREEIEDMQLELMMKTQKIRPVYVKKAEVVTRRNWRDEDDEEEKKVFVPRYKKETEFISERNIYTYGDTNQAYKPSGNIYKIQNDNIYRNQNDNIYRNQNDNIYRNQNDNIYKSKTVYKVDSVEMQSNIFRPNISNIKIQDTTKENIKEEDKYIPPVKRNEKRQDSSSWYDKK